MGLRLRVVISGRAMTYVGLSPCPKEKALLISNAPGQSELISTNGDELSPERGSSGRFRATVSPMFDNKNTG